MAAARPLVAGQRPRLVVLDGHVLNPGDNPWRELEALGELVVFARTPPELVVERAREADVVLTNKTPLSAATLAALPRLGGVCVLATGYNVVDVRAARELGIPVCNVPSYSTESVAQHVFALLLELCHRVGLHAALVRDGAWTQSPDFAFWRAPLLELDERVLGIVGFGRIGQRVAAIARAFGMTVWATPPRAGGPPPAGVEWRSMDEIFRQADVVSLHCALTADTERLVNRERLAQMKPTAFLINTARGALVDEHALAQALNDGRLAGAALDVVTVEPMTADNPLRLAERCVITPHVAWTSLRARQRLMRITADNVRGLITGAPQNLVNGA